MSMVTKTAQITRNGAAGQNNGQVSAFILRSAQLAQFKLLLRFTEPD